ncbi:unnamed protein product [Orchesella dallaii]|uniref:Uncharacterized protein n=1 Tax=Orchesella dallaii TaxID=48710 RepID=A0ABP1QQV7_9HEXA
MKHYRVTVQEFWSVLNLLKVENPRKVRKKLNDASLSNLIVNAYVRAAKGILPVDLLRVVELGWSSPPRIKDTKKESWKAMTGPWILTTYWLVSVLGRLPVGFHIAVAVDRNSLMMDNLPLSKTMARIMECGDVLEIFNLPANPTDTGTQLLCFSYNNSIKFT